MTDKLVSEMRCLNASLRAQRSNPCLLQGQMDCFVARAPRNDGETALFHGLHLESGSQDEGTKQVYDAAGLHPRLDRLLDLAALFGPVLEGADIVDLVVAEILERLAGQRGTAARGAVEDHGLVPGEILVVIGRVRIGTKLQHA